MRNNGKYTIKEIARYAGVAPSTVSRVLNNTVTSIPVTEKTRKKILRAVKEFDYSPNVNAKRLSAKKTFVIGLQVPANETSPAHAFSDHTLIETMRGIEDIVKNSEYKLLIIFKTAKYFKDNEYIKLFKEKNLDGLIIWGEHDNYAYNDAILDYPVVFVNSSPGAPQNINFITHDNYNASFMLTEHLIKKGYKNFLYLTANQTLSIVRERKAGFLDALKKHSLEIDDSKIIESTCISRQAFEIMDKILAEKKLSFDAVACINDSAAIGVYQAALKHGKKIPQDFALAGGDGVDVFGENYLPLTTFRVNCFEMGRRAVQRVFELIDDKNPTPSTEKIKAELVIRKTA